MGVDPAKELFVKKKSTETNGTAIPLKIVNTCDICIPAKVPGKQTISRYMDMALRNLYLSAMNHCNTLATN